MESIRDSRYNLNSTAWRLSSFLLFVLTLSSKSISVFANDDEPSLLPTAMDMQTQVQRLIIDFNNNADDYSSAMEKEVTALMEEVEELQATYKTIEDENFALEELIGKINTLYLSQLSTRLNNTLEIEKSRRYGELEGDNTGARQEDTAGVDIKVLERIMNVNQIMETSEIDLEVWLDKLIHSEIDEQIEKQLDEVRHSSELSAGFNSNQTSKTPPPEVCASPVDAVQSIQEALTRHEQDQIGRYDHASLGASIVYEHTSETYTPATDYSQLIGNVWWRRYVPEDWERILPEGWEEWKVGIPHYVYHSLGWRTSAAPTSPEQLLFANTLPGSCWPMAGPQGKLTLRLAYPVRVDAVTIDHLSSLLTPADGNRKSAPKRIRIVGYPPCEDADCRGMGFEFQDGKELGTFEYNIDGTSTQTFSVEKTGGEAAGDGDDNAIGGGGGEGLCSIEAASCSAPPEPTVEIFSGITLEVVENWGNPKYTCLYRFRVHGEDA